MNENIAGHDSARKPAEPAVLNDPLRNRGAAFTQAEREAAIRGADPGGAGPSDLAAAAGAGDDLAKNVYMEGLHDRNEVLYYKVLLDHLAELLPVVYDPTVGDAIEQYSHELRRSRGIYLSIDRPDDIEAAFGTLGLGPGDVDLIVCADAEEILGTGTRWREQRVVILGGGTAGVGIADQIRDQMVRDGLDEAAATRQVWIVDLPGLLTDDMGDGLLDYLRPYARPVAEAAGWAKAPVEVDPSAALRQARATSGIVTLETVVGQVKPTVLIGTSTSHGAFTQQVVEVMSAGTERPVIFPISNPTSQIEAMPADIIAWSRGKALVATGLPIPLVDYAGVRYWIGQANNALLYPGPGLGTIVADASKVTDGMLLAAARAVAGQADVSAPGASLLPAVENLRASSATTAVAVAQAADDDGVAKRKADDLVQAVQDAIWQPTYPDAV